MTTLAQVTTPPASGASHIDALLERGPGWNFVEPVRTTLRYSFSLAGARERDAGVVHTGALHAFTAEQQQAAIQVLAAVTRITGVRFEAVADGDAAELHFAQADLTGASTTGYTSAAWSYDYEEAGEHVVTRYEADAWVYLDDAEWAAFNARPAPGTQGYVVLLHEVGHAMGLSHPFDGVVTLPLELDDTAHTVMSYRSVGEAPGDYAPYDVAALQFLYGDDGLGGARGWGAPGRMLVGSESADDLRGTAGPDRFEGRAGDDRLQGGAGVDLARWSGLRADYRITHGDGGGLEVLALSSNEGRDTLVQVERLAFADGSLAFDLDGAAGVVARTLGAVFGPAAVRNPVYAGIGLALLDAGTTPDALMQAALEARLGVGFSGETLVDLLHRQLLGTPPGADELEFWSAELASGRWTPVSLAQAAAALELNAQHIDLAGLASAGLPYG